MCIFDIFNAVAISIIRQYTRRHTFQTVNGKSGDQVLLEIHRQGLSTSQKLQISNIILLKHFLSYFLLGINYDEKQIAQITEQVKKQQNEVDNLKSKFVDKLRGKVTLFYSMCLSLILIKNSLTVILH